MATVLQSQRAAYEPDDTYKRDRMDKHMDFLLQSFLTVNQQNEKEKFNLERDDRNFERDKELIDLKKKSALQTEKESLQIKDKFSQELIGKKSKREAEGRDALEEFKKSAKYKNFTPAQKKAEEKRILEKDFSGQKTPIPKEDLDVFTQEQIEQKEKQLSTMSEEEEYKFLNRNIIIPRTEYTRLMSPKNLAKLEAADMVIIEDNNEEIQAVTKTTADDMMRRNRAVMAGKIKIREHRIALEDAYRRDGKYKMDETAFKSGEHQKHFNRIMAMKNYNLSVRGLGIQEEKLAIEGDRLKISQEDLLLRQHADLRAVEGEKRNVKTFEIDLERNKREIAAAATKEQRDKLESDRRFLEISLKIRTLEIQEQQAKEANASRKFQEGLAAQRIELEGQKLVIAQKQQEIQIEQQTYAVGQRKVNEDRKKEIHDLDVANQRLTQSLRGLQISNADYARTVAQYNHNKTLKQEIEKRGLLDNSLKLTFHGYDEEEIESKKMVLENAMHLRSEAFKNSASSYATDPKGQNEFNQTYAALHNNKIKNRKYNNFDYLEMALKDSIDKANGVPAFQEGDFIKANDRGRFVYDKINTPGFKIEDVKNLDAQSRADLGAYLARKTYIHQATESYLNGSFTTHAISPEEKPILTRNLEILETMTVMNQRDMTILKASKAAKLMNARNSIKGYLSPPTIIYDWIAAAVQDKDSENFYPEDTDGPYDVGLQGQVTQGIVEKTMNYFKRMQSKSSGAKYTKSVKRSFVEVKEGDFEDLKMPEIERNFLNTLERSSNEELIAKYDDAEAIYVKDKNSKGLKALNAFMKKRFGGERWKVRVIANRNKLREGSSTMQVPYQGATTAVEYYE